MASCRGCQAKDQEIERLYAQIEALLERIGVQAETGAFARMAETVDPENTPPVPGAVPVASVIDAFREVHGRSPWAVMEPPPKEPTDG